MRLDDAFAISHSLSDDHHLALDLLTFLRVLRPPGRPEASGERVAQRCGLAQAPRDVDGLLAQGRAVVATLRIGPPRAGEPGEKADTKPVIAGAELLESVLQERHEDRVVTRPGPLVPATESQGSACQEAARAQVMGKAGRLQKRFPCIVELSCPGLGIAERQRGSPRGSGHRACRPCPAPPGPCDTGARLPRRRGIARPHPRPGGHSRSPWDRPAPPPARPTVQFEPGPLGRSGTRARQDGLRSTARTPVPAPRRCGGGASLGGPRTAHREVSRARGHAKTGSGRGCLRRA